MKRVLVYCGSKHGNEKYTDAARALGEEIAKANLELVYGGGSVGLMGTVAQSVMTNGGKVTGIIPDCLNLAEVANTAITELVVVADMHTRKKQMIEMADAAIAMPGGYGTLDEMFEFLTWAQLKLHTKPCGVLNVHGYYDKLLQFVDHMTSENLLHEDHRGLILSSPSPQELLSKLRGWVPSHHDKTRYLDSHITK